MKIEIETKYNLGDTVYFVGNDDKGNKCIRSDTIKAVSVIHDKISKIGLREERVITNIYYGVKDRNYFILPEEIEVRETEEEAIRDFGLIADKEND